MNDNVWNHFRHFDINPTTDAIILKYHPTFLSNNEITGCINTCQQNNDHVSDKSLKLKIGLISKILTEA